jgi:hypothetical protein
MNIERRQKEERLKQRFTAIAGMVGVFGAGAFAGSKQQKLEITMDATALVQIDRLVEQGLYSCREDFLQAAARNLMQEHGVQSPQISNQLTAAGVVMHNRKSLEKQRGAGKQLEFNIAGIFRLADDVTPELACAVIKSVKVRGSFHASAEVKAALKDRVL